MSNNIFVLTDLSKPVEQYFIGYVSLVEKALSSAQAKIRSERTVVKAQLRDAKKDKDEVIIQASYDHLDYLDFVEARLAYLFRSACFVTLFAFFEDKLVEVCEQFSKEIAGPDDCNCRGKIRKLSCAKKCLRQAGVDFGKGKIGDLWQRMKAYNSLRNCFVHGMGETSSLRSESDRRKVMRLAESSAQLTIRHGKVVPLEGFSEEALETFDSFFLSLADPLSNIDAS